MHKLSKRMYINLVVMIVSFLQLGVVAKAKPSAAFGADEVSQPNILWLVVEDMSPIIAPYGDHTIATPTISQLAKEGVTYTNVYSTSGVCAPSRAALATGMYPSAFGANHMRTHSDTDITGLPAYEAIPAADARMLSQYLQQHGYYTANNLKTDYQFKAPKSAWNESGPYAHWRKRPADKPFFAVFNFTTTHESGLFEPYGFRKIESRHYFSDDVAKIARLPQHPSAKSEPANTAMHVPKNTVFDIPPYLPDTPLVRRDMWKMYNNLAETDRQIAAIIQQLKDDDLYDQTVILFYSDHGGPLPRQKRLIYDSGLKVPLIIRFPNAQQGGTSDQRLISFVDFAPTTLALVGAPIPGHMHGQNFIGKRNGSVASMPREYIHAAADRFDGFTDAIRAVKDKRFKYIRNYRPEQGYYLPVSYREKIPTMQELLRLRDDGALDEFQRQWFRSRKPKEELFDTLTDPHELHNLAENEEYKQPLLRLRREMDRWLTAIKDTPNLPERALIDKLWQGADVQPKTASPEVSFLKGRVIISSQTPGASVSYRILDEAARESAWLMYQTPIKAQSGMKIEVVAHRIGFLESDIVTVSVP
ncbi:sulfatase family protein [Thalassotalea litorea]|nr:sulfatase [Thalassotalea litorea]